MKEMISMLAQKDGGADKDKGARSSSNNERDLLVWRRKLDDLKSKSMKKQEHLRGIQDKLSSLASAPSKPQGPNLSE
jgi:coiled-coil domain-containing protein 151